MRYQVPQFIEVEDKIFGPLTIKQFIYLVAGAALCYILYNFLPFFIAVLFIIPTAGFFAALAFYKINNKPFINVLESGFRFYVGNKLYIWKKVPKKIIPQEEQKREPTQLVVPKLSDSKLKDLSWSLDINERSHGTVYSKETGVLQSRKELDDQQREQLPGA